MDGNYPFLDLVTFEAVVNVLFKYNVMNSRRTTNLRMSTLL
jgi:hypothetical protein